MTNKLKKVLIVLLLFVFVVSASISIAGCTKSSYTTDDYVYNDPYAAQLDEGVKLDGVLNESFWQTSRSLTRGIDYLDINCKMNSYFGDYGIYMSFEVNDSEVYYNATRASHANTGIELYVSSSYGEKDLAGYGYEIDFNAGGRVNVKKRNSKSYVDVSDYARMGVMIDGELNTSFCEGYVLEVFMPYIMFGGKIDFLYVMPALIRTNSDLGTDRLWYNLLTENDGAANAYFAAKNWYQFDKNGVVAHEIDTIKTGDGNGSINMAEYALTGRAFDINLVANDDSYVSTFKVNGVDALNDTTMSFDGANYTIDKVTDNVTVEVEFSKIPIGNSQLGFDLTLNKQGIKKLANGANVQIKDKNDNIIFNQTIDEDGKIDAGTLTNGKYFVTCSYEGYITTEEIIYLRTDLEYKKELQFKLFSNENEQYDIRQANDGIIKASLNSNTDLIFTEQSQDFYLEVNLRADKTDISNDARFYLKFYDKKGGAYGVRTMEKYGTSSLNGIAFCGWGESDYISWKNYAFNTAQLNAMYGDGLKLAFVRASGMFYVYVYDVTNEKFVTALSKQVGIDDTYALSKYMPYEITDFKYETAESFGTFIKNPLNVWDYADVENGNVEFTGKTGILQFNKQVENFSLEFNYKRSGDTASGQDSGFYLRFDDKNGHYGVRIMESANSPTNISFCTFSGANVGWKAYNFTSGQKTAIKNDGLKFKIQRLNGVITVYVENLTTNEMDLVLTSTETIGNGDVVSLTGWQPYALTSFIYNTQLN